MNRPRLDLLRIGLSIAVGGGLTVILAVVLLRHAQSRPHVGPTSATLDEAFSELLGLALGLLAGSALASTAVRWGSRFVSGVLAGTAVFVAVATPYLFLTSDTGPSETLGFLEVFVIYAVPFVLLGAGLGWGIGQMRRGHPTKTAPR